MKSLPTPVLWLCRLIIGICLPFVLVLINVRLLMTPVFPEIEYRLPGFPADAYGLTFEQRMFWAKRSIAYILSDPSVGAIEQWLFPEDGISPPGTMAPFESCAAYGNTYGPRDCTYFYNDREVKHMIDVQIITGYVQVALVVGSLLLAGAGALLWRAGQLDAVRAPVRWGTGSLLGVLTAIIIYLSVNFMAFFTQFHRLFFEGDTWLFLWSDSLIRLFPTRFWQDAFIFVGGGAMVYAAVLFWVVGRKAAKN